MNWLELYIKKAMLYDLVLRSPNLLKGGDLLDCMKNYSGKIEISFSKLKNKDEISLYLSALLNEFSLGNKVRIVKTKGFSGKKVYSLRVKMQKNGVINFLDFFLNLVIKGLKRRFIVLKSSYSLTGVLNLRFSSVSELEIDDFFFFDIDEWPGNLNIFLYFSSKPFLSQLFSLYFLNIFNLKRLSKYEVFSGKG